MPYTPDPTLVTQPVDTVDAGTAAAEFRALKAWVEGKKAAVYNYASKQVTDTTGTITAAATTAAATITATDLVTFANSSGTLTFTCVKAGVYEIVPTMAITTAEVGESVMGRFTIGGTGTLLNPASPLAVIAVNANTPAAGGSGATTKAGSAPFFVSLTVGQTVTVLPAFAVNGGAAAASTYNMTCSVAAKYMGLL